MQSYNARIDLHNLFSWKCFLYLLLSGRSLLECAMILLLVIVRATSGLAELSSSSYKPDLVGESSY